MNLTEDERLLILEDFYRIPKEQFVRSLTQKKETNMEEAITVTTPVSDGVEVKNYVFVGTDDQGNPIKVEIDANGNVQDVEEDVKVN